MDRARLAVLAAFLILAAPAGAFQLNEVKFACAVNSVQAADPLVDPGVSPSAHSHTQGGATVFGASETLGDMLGAADTTCPLPGDRTSFWAPTPLRPDGTPATVTSIQYWLTNLVPYTTPTGAADASAFSPGLRFVRGDHGCTLWTCKSTVYECRSAGPNNNTLTIPTAAECGNERGYMAIQYVVGYQCWDGQSLGQGMGDSTPANVFDVNIVRGTDGTCPPDNPATIPGVAVELTVAGDGYGGCLSSDIVNAGGQPGDPCSILDTAGVDPGSSGHADWVDGLTPGDQATIDSACLNPDFNTGAFPLGTGARDTCKVKAAGGLWAYDPDTGRFDTFVLDTAHGLDAKKTGGLKCPHRSQARCRLPAPPRRSTRPSRPGTARRSR